MKDYEKKFMNEFSKINITEESTNEIKENIRKRYTKRKIRNKTILCISSILFVFLVGFSFVYAKELKDFINRFIITKHVDEKGNEYISGKASFVKEMNYDADIPEVVERGTGETYKIKDLEKLLDMKILRSDYIKTDEIKQSLTKKVDNKIASSSFTIDNFTRPTKKEDTGDKYNLTISFTTKYSDNNTSYFNMSPGVASKEYHIKGLDTNAYILLINVASPQDRISRAFAGFIYDNVEYFIDFRFLPKEYQNDATQIIRDVLDSFYVLENNK